MVYQIEQEQDYAKQARRKLFYRTTFKQIPAYKSDERLFIKHMEKMLNLAR